MDNIYYYVGLFIVWAIILIASSFILAFSYHFLKKCIPSIFIDWWCFYILRNRIDNKTLRNAYRIGWFNDPHRKRIIFKYRLRNIKNT